MTITPTVHDFPTLPVSGQIYHVPGGAFQGGLTVGGSQIITPEPGGFGVLELQLSLQTSEWQYPNFSWLMSKMNGELLRIRLAPTPQIPYSPRRYDSVVGVTWDTGLLWTGDTRWSGDMNATAETAALSGATTLQVDLTNIGAVLEKGHVIGHRNTTYLVDNVSYAGDIATVTTRTPLRFDVAINDDILLRPYFTGRIINAAEVLAMYEAAMVGNVQPGKIVMVESIVDV